VEHAELVAPGVAHDPEVKAALLLMVIAGRAQRLQALDLGLNIVVSKSRCIRSLDTFSSRPAQGTT